MLVATLGMGVYISSDAQKDAWRSRPPLVTTGRLFRRPRHPPIIVDLASTDIRVLLDIRKLAKKRTKT